MNVFNTTSALANLQQWIIDVKFAVPAQSTSCNFFGLLNRFSFFFYRFIFLYLSWSNIFIWSFFFEFFIMHRFLRWLFVHLTRTWRNRITVDHLRRLLLFFFLVCRWVSDFWTIIFKHLLLVYKHWEGLCLSNNWIDSNNLLNLIKVLGLVDSKGIF